MYSTQKSILALKMASVRQFGTELSANNAPTTPRPRNSLKRPAPRLYKDRPVDNNRAGKKARTLADFNIHFQDNVYKPPPQRKRVQYNHLGVPKLM